MINKSRRILLSIVIDALLFLGGCSLMGQRFSEIADQMVLSIAGAFLGVSEQPPNALLASGMGIETFETDSANQRMTFIWDAQGEYNTITKTTTYASTYSIYLSETGPTSDFAKFAEVSQKYSENGAPKRPGIIITELPHGKKLWLKVYCKVAGRSWISLSYPFSLP